MPRAAACLAHDRAASYRKHPETVWSTNARMMSGTVSSMVSPSHAASLGRRSAAPPPQASTSAAPRQAYLRFPPLEWPLALLWCLPFPLAFF